MPPKDTDMPPLVRFEAATAEFSSLYSDSTPPVLLASSEEPLFHEAGVWMPQIDSFLVTSNRLLPDTDQTHVKICAVHWPSGRVTQLNHLEDQIVMGNGGTSDWHGGAYLLSQGLNDTSGTVWHIDPHLNSCTLVGPLPDGELLFNSLNDIVVHRATGCLLFTDPAYGAEVQGFRTTFNEAKAVWCFNPTTSKWTMLDHMYDAPNGILLSPDERTCYVSDVWNDSWATACKSCVKIESCASEGGTEAKKVVKYDVQLSENGMLKLANRSIFFDLKNETDSDTLGYPDGLKCDALGNVYAGCGDGVRVYAADGTFCGRLCVDGGVANLVFGGKDGCTLLIFNETRAIAVAMNVAGAFF